MAGSWIAKRVTVVVAAGATVLGCGGQADFESTSETHQDLGSQRQTEASFTFSHTLNSPGLGSPTYSPGIRFSAADDGTNVTLTYQNVSGTVSITVLADTTFSITCADGSVQSLFGWLPQNLVMTPWAPQNVATIPSLTCSGHGRPTYINSYTSFAY